MINFCVVNPDGIIENVIVFADEATAKEFGAVPGYEGAGSEIHTSHRLRSHRTGPAGGAGDLYGHDDGHADGGLMR